MSPAVHFTFRLYLADNSLNSAQARANLTALCREHLADRHDIEVVDVFSEPLRALADGVFMTPTLVKLSPLPQRRIVGPLTHLRATIEALGLDEAVVS